MHASAVRRRLLVVGDVADGACQFKFIDKGQYLMMFIFERSSLSSEPNGAGQWVWRIRKLLLSTWGNYQRNGTFSGGILKP
jgi:hypothetical protein